MENLTSEEDKLIEIVYSRRKIYFESSDRSFLDHITNIFIFENNTDEVKYILEFSRNMKVNLFRMLFSRHNADLSQACVIHNPASYLLINDFGVTNRYYTSSMCNGYLWNTKLIYENVDDAMSYEIEAKRIAEKNSVKHLNFRSYQLLCLYAQYRLEIRHFPSQYESALAVLWNSIPEPYLITKEFIRSFDGFHSERMPTVMNAWYWYCRLVRDSENQEKCPRSLKHLSRCVVRERLADCFQMPNGILELDIPQTLKPYLLLRDFKITSQNQNRALMDHSYCHVES